MVILKASFHANGLFGEANQKDYLINKNSLSMLFANLYQPRHIFWFYTSMIVRYSQVQEIGDF